MQALQDTKQLGLLVRKTRKSQGLTQKELAGLTGVGERFVRDLERGKDTCQTGKVMHTLKMLGIHIYLSCNESDTL